MNKAGTSSGLPEDVEAKLIDLWNAAMPTKDIARELGVTKNSVVGRIRRMVEKGVVAHRDNPIPFHRSPDGTMVPVVSHETVAREERALEAVIKAEVQEQIEAAIKAVAMMKPVSHAARVRPDDDAPIIPPVPPVIRHTRASLRRMDEMAAIDLPTATLRPNGELFFFFAPSKVEPFIPPPEPRKGCPWIVSEPGAGDKRRWQGATFCGKRVAEGMTYCPQHQSIASTGFSIRRGLVVY